MYTIWMKGQETMKCKECGWESFDTPFNSGADQDIQVDVEEPNDAAGLSVDVGITVTVTLSCPECSEELGKFDGNTVAEVELGEA
jgi:hypothetical protein